VSHDEHHITEVSDPRALTLDEPPTQAVQDVKIVKGDPTQEELAALIAVLGAAAGSPIEPGPQELNLWGHPVDKLRFAPISWQLVTLVERTHMRR
jgi:hypothetical protein